jgi:hypothetical protein
VGDEVGDVGGPASVVGPVGLGRVAGRGRGVLSAPAVVAGRVGLQRDGSDSSEVANLIETDFSAAGAEQDVIVFDSETLTITDPG